MGEALQILNSFAALAVVWGSICALNGMHRKSPTVFRTAHVLLAVGAAGVLIAPIYLGRGPTIAEMLMIYGTAIFALRRACHCHLHNIVLWLSVRLTLMKYNRTSARTLRWAERLLARFLKKPL